MSIALVERTGFEVDAIDVFCADEETEILTSRGWLRHGELRAGDLAWGIDPETQRGLWTRVERVNRFPAAPRKLLRIEGRGMSALVTAGHRWLVRRRHGQTRGASTRRCWEFRTSGHLDAECAIPTAACPTLVTPKVYSDTLVEAVAWYWTEGHDRRAPQSGVMIAQSLVANPRHVEAIRRALTGTFGPASVKLPGLGGPAAWVERRNGRNAEFCLNRAAGAELQQHAPGRVPSPTFLCALTAAQLDRFIERSLDGDGTRSGVHTLAQKSEAAASMFQMACILAGRSANLRFRKVRPTVPYRMATVAVNQRSAVKPMRQAVVEWVEHEGLVWCPTTTVGTWLARRRGTTYFTGNCGFGGSSQGIHKSGATVRVAANHSELALDCHAKNFPQTEHWQADMVDASDPQVLDRKGKKVSGRYLDPATLPAARYSWFSPACTHHSMANAKKIYARGLQVALFEDEDWDHQRYANSERSRVTMSCVLKYAAARRPEIVVVENVVEVTKWGPNGNGATFKWWLAELDKLGYDHHLCWFNSMFFPPCPQSRDRLYIVAWRKGNTAPTLDYRPTAYCTSQRCGGRIVEAIQTWKRPTAAWVTETWGKYGSQYDYRCPECSSVVHPASWMALSAIDFTNLGPTLEERIAAGKRPAPNTWERIRRAVEKYRNAPPIILPKEVVGAQQVEVAHTEAGTASVSASDRRCVDHRVRSVAERLPTLAQRNTVGMVVDGAVVPLRSGRPRADALGSPLPALVANGSRLALALTVKNNGALDEAGYRGHHTAESLGSITAHPSQSVVALVVPNRTNNVAHHAGETLDPVMTSATEAVVLAAAGNTYEPPGQTRARAALSPLFTQSATAEFAVAAAPVLRGDHFQDRHVGESMCTVSAGGGRGGEHHAVVTALFSKINGGPEDTSWHGMADPLNTITGRDTTGLVVVPWIEHWQSDPVHVTEQLATITARLRHTLASIEPSDEPITDEQMLGVRFRMLEPDPELRRAMAFDDDYILIGNKGQMTAGLGNAVTPPVAEWITERCLATLR